MSGQQVLTDFIEEALATAKASLDRLKSENIGEQNLEELAENIRQAESDFAVINSIKDIFDKGQLTEKRFQERLKSLREVKND